MKAEGDIVASTKEPEQAGQQLIKERETLAEKIQKLEVPFKMMIMKNDQISELQKCGRSRTRRRQGITWL